MTTNNDERVTVYANVYEKDTFLWPTEEQANTMDADWVVPRIRLAKCHELRPGETIVPREKIERLRDEYRRIAKDPKTSHQDCFCRSAQAIAIDAVLDILDGKDGA